MLRSRPCLCSWRPLYALVCVGVTSRRGLALLCANPKMAVRSTRRRVLLCHLFAQRSKFVGSSVLECLAIAVRRLRVCCVAPSNLQVPQCMNEASAFRLLRCSALVASILKGGEPYGPSHWCRRVANRFSRSPNSSHMGLQGKLCEPRGFLTWIRV